MSNKEKLSSGTRYYAYFSNELWFFDFRLIESLIQLQPQRTGHSRRPLQRPLHNQQKEANLKKKIFVLLDHDIFICKKIQTIKSDQFIEKNFWIFTEKRTQKVWSSLKCKSQREKYCSFRRVVEDSSRNVLNLMKLWVN